MYFVYVLLSTIHPKIYVGITDDIIRRLNEHNKGYHVYTKQYKPWKVIFLEEHDSRSLARKREKYLKGASGRRWMRKSLFNK